MAPQALAIFAHPDDIEFVAAGTLLLLRNAGYGLHYFNLCNGSCGSTVTDADETARIRLGEAQNAAAILGAKFYEPIANDLELVYSTELLRRVASVVRRIAPTIVLTHAPVDYMEDHMMASRLAVTAAFAHGMPNFRTDPAQPPFDAEIAVYHSLPHGLRDGMGNKPIPDFVVDTTSTHGTKRHALAAHQSQKKWLDESQGMDSYLETMDTMSREIAELAGGGSGEFEFAEGWRQHNWLGLSSSDFDPLRKTLTDYIKEPAQA